MTVPSRNGWVALFASSLAGLLGFAACAPSAEPRSCSTAAECPAGSRCISSACVANSPPVVAVAVPASPQANALLSFDASATADPDPGDSVVSFAWAFRALSGQTCAPPVVAGTGPIATLRFGCPGRYAVDVTATDQMGASATLTKELDVAPYSGPTLLTVGADVAVDHACTPAPSCTTAAPVALSAAAPGFAPGQVSFSWSVAPPADRPLTSRRRVTFSPGAAVPSPTVAIVTDGDAISGDWLFQVEARDAAGVIGTATMRVSVKNRPPVLTKSIPSPNHSFDGSQFTASGEVPYTVSDPDGDPLLAPVVQWRHAGDGGSTFSGVVLSAPSRVTFSIAVPFATRTDAANLIGGAGLERTILFAISDVNGAVTAESWPIVVLNRPPSLVSAPAALTVDHTYDPVGHAYVADVPLSTWADPDGDPLWQVPGSLTGDSLCPQLVIVGGVAHAQCRLAFTGTPAVAAFAGAHSVSQAVQDPWAAAATSQVSFTIANRPPSITSTATVADGFCTYTSSCCQTLNGACEFMSATVSGVVHVPSRWADPDGDPISVQVSTAGIFTPVQPLVCTPATCVLDVAITPTRICDLGTLYYLPTTVSDGFTSATGTLPMQGFCP